MENFPPLTMESCPDGFHVRHRLKTPADLPSRALLVAVDPTHVILADANSKSPDWTPQLAMPIAGLRWCLEAIAVELLGKPGEGGLPPGRLSTKSGPFSGEILKVMRMGVALPFGAPPGVDISNLSRKDEFSDPLPQGIVFTDHQLYHEGAWDALCDVVNHWLESSGEAPLPPDIMDARPHGFA